MRASRPLLAPAPGRPVAGRLVAAAVVAAAAGPRPAAAHPEQAAPRASKLFEVPSGAMLPTIPLGAYIRVELYGRPERARPAVGTIVFVHPPRGAITPPEDVDEDGFARCGDRRAFARGRLCSRPWGGRSADRFVERIVAGPGDTVALSRGRVVRNGVPVDEPYAATSCDHDEFPCTARRPVRLGRNRYFLLGDNRDEALDSRFWGPVPRAWLIGKVTAIDVPAEPMIPFPSR